MNKPLSKSKTVDVAHLMAEAEAAGVSVKVIGGQLTAWGPEETKPLLRRLHIHKAAIKAFLRDRAERPLQTLARAVAIEKVLAKPLD